MICYYIKNRGWYENIKKSLVMFLLISLTGCMKCNNTMKVKTSIVLNKKLFVAISSRKDEK
jgi:hypothetical protein